MSDETQIGQAVPHKTRHLDSGAGNSPSQSTQLVNLAREAELFRTPDGKGYATVKLDGRLESFPIRSADFKSYLGLLYRRESGKVPGQQALQDAIATLESTAIFDGVQKNVYCRVAQYDGHVYVDLINESRQVIKISPEGWTIEADVPVRFRRAKAMLALPTPISGCKLDNLLRPFFAVTDNDFILIIGWLLSTLQIDGAYPLLIVKGEQGSAKSTTCRMLRKIIDPNAMPARAQPRDERDLVIGLVRSHIGCFDNISEISNSFSDSLCRVSTGQGFATRALYADDDEVIFELRRPILMNGIGDLASRGDLADRALVVELPRILEGERKTEEEVWEKFDEAHPFILGALLDAAAVSLRNRRGVESTGLPRMSDFAQWVIAAECHLGWEPGRFLRAYHASKRDAEIGVLESSPVANVIRRIAEQKWEGTPTQLLARISDVALPHEHRHPEFPRTAQRLGNEVKRLALSLRSVGTIVAFGKSGNRYIRISQVGSH